MRELMARTIHTIGYIVLTGGAVWLIFRFAPELTAR